jgi:glutathione synthase/RimK-type ligase-like ATP-grasp enzyme
MTSRVLIATCAQWPDLVADEELVVPALAARGIAAEPAVWTDPDVDWAADAVVIRTTWDYFDRRDDFVSWSARVGATTPMWNTPEVIRRNTDKRYLAELASAGVPTVPTEWIGVGADVDLAEVLERRGWDVAVVKPTVSAGARDTMKITGADLAAATELVRRVTVSREVMVQPYLQSVEEYGERALVFVDGELSHAVRKHPMLAGPTSPFEAEPAVAAADETALAEQVLSTVDDDLLYARVDIARFADGSPVLMELELTEPRLFLADGVGAADRLAAAIERRVR